MVFYIYLTLTLYNLFIIYIHILSIFIDWIQIFMIQTEIMKILRIIGPFGD